MRNIRLLFAAAAAVGLVALETPTAQADGWVGSWGASIVFPVGPDVHAYQTLRQFVRLSAGGPRLRVRISNATGVYPLVIGAAHIANPAADGAKGAIDPASDHKLTFGGAPWVTVPPGAETLSDPVEMNLPSLSTVAISLFVPRWTGPSVIHLDGVTTSYISNNGDATAEPALPSPSTSSFRFFIDEVDVEAPGQPGAVVTLGDSITDGNQSTVDANHRWPDRLAERLAARQNANPVGVINAGLSGNRILHDHPEDLFGPSALARLNRDVLETPGLKWVVLLMGINDIAHNDSGGLTEQAVSADEIIAGMKEIIARVHERGAKIYGATLTPYEDNTLFKFYQPAGEKKRQAVNAWIRNGGEFDAVIDFDALVRDPDHPTRMRADLDSGDHLHPNDAGYRAMGDAIDLKLFE